MAAESPVSDRDRREFFRVSTVLPLRQRVASEEDREALAREGDPISLESPRTADLDLQERLDRMERKLELVLSLLDPKFPRPLDETDLRVIELSGSGIRYSWPEPISPGTDVLLHFALPGPPTQIVRCIASVIRCGEPEEVGGQHLIAVAFEQIASADRDAIVRHTLEVQREARRAMTSDFEEA